MAAAAVAAINAEPGSVGVQRIGCYALMQLARDAAGAQTVVEAGGIGAVVTAMELQAADAADAEVHRFGCTTLSSLARSDAAHKQAVVNGGGVRAVVAAMGLHTADAELHHAGVATLSSLAFSDAAHEVQRAGVATLSSLSVTHKQAVVDGGGGAAVVAAIGLHAADAGLQGNGCCALWNLASGGAACAQAVVDAGGVRALVAAMGQHQETAGNAAGALEMLAANNPMAVLEEVARTQTDG